MTMLNRLKGLFVRKPKTHLDRLTKLIDDLEGDMDYPISREDVNLLAIRKFEVPAVEFGYYALNKNFLDSSLFVIEEVVKLYDENGRFVDLQVVLTEETYNSNITMTIPLKYLHEFTVDKIINIEVKPNGDQL